jgi:hypothetical protein
MSGYTDDSIVRHGVLDAHISYLQKPFTPDVLVTKGLRPDKRLNYILWQERKPPNIVIELTSKSTRHEDLNRKFLIYQDQICVPEYFLFDPLGDYLQPRLQGFRLQRGKYVAIRPAGDHLKSSDLDRGARGRDDERTGERLLTPRELVAAGKSEMSRLASRERAAREQAEQEVARLRDELKKLRKR